MEAAALAATMETIMEAKGVPFPPGPACTQEAGGDPFMEAHPAKGADIPTTSNAAHTMAATAKPAATMLATLISERKPWADLEDSGGEVAPEGGTSFARPIEGGTPKPKQTKRSPAQKRIAKKLRKQDHEKHMANLLSEQQMLIAELHKHGLGHLV